MRVPRNQCNSRAENQYQNQKYQYEKSDYLCNNLRFTPIYKL